MGSGAPRRGRDDPYTAYVTGVGLADGFDFDVTCVHSAQELQLTKSLVARA